MAYLPLQSIGIVGGSLVSTPVNAQTQRAGQATSQAGIQRQQNIVRAVSSATNVQHRQQRSVQDDTRVEGAFEESAEEHEKGSHEPGQPPSGRRRIDKIV